MDLSRYTVLEVGEYVATPYAGKVFSDLGAEVIKLEPPEGDVARDVGPFVGDGPRHDASTVFGYLNTGKKSTTLARDGTAPRAVRELIEAEDVDLVIEDALADYGVEPAAVVDTYPDLSVVSLSDFGTTGPFQAYDAPDLIAGAESGQLNKTGYPDRPPTRMGIKAIDYVSGTFGAVGGLAALLARDRQGIAGQHVDVSQREAGAASMSFFLTGYSWSGLTTQRTGNGYPLQGNDTHSRMIYEADDGHVSLSATRWEAFCEDVLERPDLIEDERFSTRESRSEHREEITEIIENYTKSHEKWDLLERLQAAGLPSAITATMEDIVQFDHLDERDFWTELDLPNGHPVTMPGFPFQVDDERVEMDPAPRLGEHDGEFAAAPGDSSGAASPGAGPTDRDVAANGAGTTGPTETDWSADATGIAPLEGVRVLDFTWVVAGPQATKQLAALGADVVKIESKTQPDVLRRGRKFDFEDPENLDVSAFWHEYNLGKRGIQIDLTTDRGMEIVRSLIAEVDVVVENFSPTFMDRIGLDHETIHDINPDAVYLSMPGWGNTGPAKSYRSFGLNLQSMAGLDALTGFPEDPPTTAGLSWPDYQAGAMGPVGVLAGLLERERTGEGVYIELAQYELSVSFLHKQLMQYRLTGEQPERVGNRDEDRRYVQNVYPCEGEDRWAAIAVETDEQWNSLCAAMGRPELADDERFCGPRERMENHDEIDDIVGAWTSQRTPEEVRTRLQERGVPAGIVANERDLHEYDPQLRVREFFVEQDHPEVGEQRYSGAPVRMQRSRVGFTRRPPLFGEHTDEILEDWIGMSPADIESARDDGVLN